VVKSTQRIFKSNSSTEDGLISNCCLDEDGVGNEIREDIGMAAEAHLGHVPVPVNPIKNR